MTRLEDPHQDIAEVAGGDHPLASRIEGHQIDAGAVEELAVAVLQPGMPVREGVKLLIPKRLPGGEMVTVAPVEVEHHGGLIRRQYGQVGAGRLDMWQRHQDSLCLSHSSRSKL